MLPATRRPQSCFGKQRPSTGHCPTCGPSGTKLDTVTVGAACASQAIPYRSLPSAPTDQAGNAYHQVQAQCSSGSAASIGRAAEFIKLLPQAERAPMQQVMHILYRADGCPGAPQRHLLQQHWALGADPCSRIASLSCCSRATQRRVGGPTRCVLHAEFIYRRRSSVTAIRAGREAASLPRQQRARTGLLPRSKTRACWGISCPCPHGYERQTCASYKPLSIQCCCSPGLVCTDKQGPSRQCHRSVSSAVSAALRPPSVRATLPAVISDTSPLHAPAHAAQLPPMGLQLLRLQASRARSTCLAASQTQPT